MNIVEQKLLDHAPLAVFWTREDGSFAYVNKTACSSLGYTREELLQLSIFDVDPDVTPEFWKAHWLDVPETGIVTLERLHRRRDGSRISVEVQVQHISVSDEFVHVSFVRDLTDENKVAAQRESHLSYLDALFNKSPVPQLIIDPDNGRIVEANPAASTFYKYPSENLCKMQIQQINLMGEERIKEEIERARKRKRNFFRFRHADAENGIHDVQVFSVPILRDGRQMLHSTVLDVTALVRSRSELQHQQALLKRLPIGVYQATLGGEGIFLQANPALRKILDLPDGHKVVGRRVADFYADPEERAKLSDRILEAGQVIRDVRRARTESGRLIWIAITSRATRLRDGDVVLEGAIEDVTELREAEFELDRAAARAINALDAAPIPMMLYTADGRVEAVNRVWCDITGYSPEQLKTLDDWTQLAYGSDAGAILNEIRNMIRAGQRVSEGDFRVRCADGEIRIWAFYSGPLEFDGETASLVLSTAMDVTEQRRHERRMRQSDAIVQSAHEGITITDADRNIERVNAAFTRITGYTESEVRGRNPRILSSGRQDSAFYEQMWSQINRLGYWQGEVWNRRKSGEIYPEWLSITEIRDSEKQTVNYVGVFHDLTELKQSQAERDHLQRFDSLTSLPNQRLLLEKLAERLAGVRKDCGQIVVIVCGLDRFRIINESFSYIEGDRILKTIAERLRQVQDQHVELARPGSDHFAFVIGSGASNTRTLDLVDRIAALLSKPVKTAEGQDLNIQCSVGIARFPDDGESPEELLRNAETAMFHAKRTRRGSHIFFSSEQTEGGQEKLEIETRIRRAIDEHAFEFHFQPVVCVDQGTIVGAEALARWPSADNQSVPPDVFIPVAEQTGMIEKLTFQLLQPSCLAAAEFQRKFSPQFRLAFNISALLLNDNQFDRKIFESLENAGFAPTQFEIELTESTLLEQAQGTSRVLKRLRDSGIRISIDDFGTGFSSLAYLQEIDAQFLKIDRRFVQRVATHPADAQIAGSIIAMAHALGMETIAEGVETQQQLEFLRRHGCDFYQGYLFSKPLPPSDFEKLYRSNQAKIGS